MGILRRIKELENENDILRELIRQKDVQFCSILEQVRRGHAQNLAVAFKYYANIKDLAEKGLDIKIEEDE